MAWIESHQELREHPKTKRLCRVLALPRPMVVGYLHFLWWWAYDYSADGDLSKFTDEDIADAIDWEGDPGELVAALTQCGFLTEGRQIHDWEDFAQKWIERRRQDRERKRAGRQKTDDVRRMSDGHPPEVHSLSGVTVPDHTGPNSTGPDLEPQVPDALVVAGGAGGEQPAADHGAIAPPKPKRAKPRGTKPRTDPPETLEPNEADYAAGARVGLTRDEVDSKAALMLDRHRSEGKDSADWHASLRTWLGNSPKYDQPRAPNSYRNGSAKPPPKRPGPPIPAEAAGYFQTRTGTLPRR